MLVSSALKKKKGKKEMSEGMMFPISYKTSCCECVAYSEAGGTSGIIQLKIP